MKKLVQKSSRILMIGAILLASFVGVNAQTICDNGIGTQGGYTYEYWKDYGGGCMTLNDGGTFYIDWSNIGNLLARKGLRPGSTNQVVTYGANYQPNGNSFLCVYGWTTDPLIEYYIVDSWGTWRPPGDVGFMGTMSSDGATYDIYRTERVQQPSIQGTQTFYQYWSVRQSKRTSGTITCENHFNAWAGKGMNMGSLYEVSLCVEGYQSSGTCDVYSMSMTTGSSGGSTTDDVSSVSTPTSVTQNSTATVNVNYSSSTNRDVVVMFQLASSPWTVYAQEKKDVSAGSGSLSFSMNIPSDVPVASGAYQFQTLITTDGGGWDQRLDNIAKTGISVTSSGSSGGGTTTEAPVGSTIWLKANANGKYVCAEKNVTNSPLEADRSAVGSWEKFDVEDAGDGMIALKAYSNSKYVTANTNTTDAPLQAIASSIQDWEKFTWVENSDGSISLMANANGKYVCAENTGDRPLEADRGAIGAWEKFTWAATSKSAETLVDERPPLDVFPNPATNSLYIDNMAEGVYSLQVIDIQGKSYLNYSLESDGAEMIDISALPVGMYILKIQSEHELKTARFTKTL